MPTSRSSFAPMSKVVIMTSKDTVGDDISSPSFKYFFLFTSVCACSSFYDTVPFFFDQVYRFPCLASVLFCEVFLFDWLNNRFTRERPLIQLFIFLDYCCYSSFSESCYALFGRHLRKHYLDRSMQCCVGGESGVRCFFFVVCVQHDVFKIIAFLA